MTITITEYQPATGEDLADRYEGVSIIQTQADQINLDQFSVSCAAPNQQHTIHAWIDTYLGDDLEPMMGGIYAVKEGESAVCIGLTGSQMLALAQALNDTVRKAYKVNNIPLPKVRKTNGKK